MLKHKQTNKNKNKKKNVLGINLNTKNVANVLLF